MRYVLDNGITVIFERQKAAPVVAIQVWVKAGSADETPEEAGLAHLHEHMLFKGTARRKLGEIARDVEGRGGEINAWTSFDQTVYHVVLASAFAHEGIDILADAVRNSAFDRDELAREIEVVVEEIKRAKDSPSRRVSREMFLTAYQRHPYRLPVLGTEESVRSFTREKVTAFFEKHYRPDNITVVVVGDMEEGVARREIERHFGGDWGRSPRAPVQRPAEPEQNELRLAMQSDGVKEGHLALAWHIPGIDAEDLPALDLLANVLGQGEGSRLNLALKLQQQVVNETYAYAYTPKDPGLMVAGFTAAPGKVRQAIPALLAEVQRVRHQPVTAEELATASAMLESDMVYGKETVQGVARKLGFYETTCGSLEFEKAYYARVAKVTADEVQRVAEKYLRPQNLTVSGLLPSGVELSDDELRTLVHEGDRARPAPLPARPPRAAPKDTSATRAPFRRPTTEHGGIVRARLANGVTVLVKPERAVPLVAMRAVWPGGLRYETPETNGISQLYGRMLTRTTQHRSSEDIAREIDELAGALNGSAGRNSIGLRGEFLSKHFERGFRLFSECLEAPGFDEAELEHERALLLQEIHTRDDNPAGAAFDLFTSTLFQVHPYRLDTLGSEEAVRRITPAHLRELRERTLHPSHLTLCIVGDVDPDRAFSLAEELLGRDAGAAPKLPAIPAEPALTRPRREFKELDKAQAHLVYGFLGTTVANEDRYALDVLSSVLSGQGGRLFVELRDKKSLAYSISSFSVEGIDPGYFGVYMGTSPEKVSVAVQGILEELRKAVESPISASELERAQRYLIGTHAIGLQKNSARAALIAFDEAYGLGADNYRRYQERIEAVTVARVQEVARRLLVADRAALAIVGPKAADVTPTGW
ncbi:MAG: M16 family metallopeptidase [Myxococcales bacterium]